MILGTVRRKLTALVAFSALAAMVVEMSADRRAQG